MEEKENKIEEDEIRVVGTRCRDFLIEPIPGSWKAVCCECGEDVWLTEIWKDKKIDKIMCDDCCYDKGIYKGKDVQLRVTTETLDKFVKWAREYYGDLIIDQSDDDIKLTAIELIENKFRKELKVTKLEDLNKE